MKQAPHKYCRRCGKELPQERELRFCPHCGVAVLAVKPDSVEAQVLALLHQGQKIHAIKLYRDRTGFGLKQAKEQVEAIAGRHGIQGMGGGTAARIVLALAGFLVLAVAGLVMYFVSSGD